MKLPNNIYDWLKWIAMMFLPALSVAYSSLAGIWGLPFGDEVPATLTVLDLFLGSLLGVSTAQYNRLNGGGDRGKE